MFRHSIHPEEVAHNLKFHAYQGCMHVHVYADILCGRECHYLSPGFQEKYGSSLAIARCQCGWVFLVAALVQGEEPFCGVCGA